MSKPPANIDPKIDPDDFVEACMQAAVRWNVNAFYLISVAQIESRTRNEGTAGSDAFGPFQILEDTWNDYRGDSGFSEDDRFDPFRQAFVAGHIAADGVKSLRPVLLGNRMPTDAELYLTHLFGQRGGATVLNGNRGDGIDVALARVYPGKPAKVQAVLSANSSLLAPHAQPRSVQGVLDEVERRLVEARKLVLPAEVINAVEPQLSGQLVARVVDGNSTFFILDKFDDEGGGQFLVKQIAGQQPQVLLSDAIVFPVPAGVVPADIAAELNKAFQAQTGPNPPGTSVQPGADVSKLVLNQATASDGHLITRDVANTNGGRLACAWAVNHVVQAALGKPVGGGLSTTEMHKVLTARHIQKTEAQIVPGLIIISPTQGGNVGHVGIVGQAGAANTPIFSNSSGAGMFMHKFTLASWKAQYQTKQHLPVKFFALDATKL